MKTYFAISDVHSCFKPMKAALWAAGFRRTNKDHILIVCGDLFDRGDDTMQVYRYIKSLPKSRRILIRGNHELLYKMLLRKSFPDSYDFANGTVKTFCAVAGMSEEMLSARHWYKAGVDGYEAYNRIIESWETIRKEVKASDLTKFVFSAADWRDYFELGKYVFVHSFIPTGVKAEHMEEYLQYGYSHDDWREFDPDWRGAARGAWDCAVWDCPFTEYDQGLFAPEASNGKVLVCGHWHAAAFHERYEGAEPMKNHDIYVGEHLIALDACTIVSNKVNVLKLQESDV